MPEETPQSSRISCEIGIPSQEIFDLGAGQVAYLSLLAASSVKGQVYCILQHSNDFVSCVLR